MAQKTQFIYFFSTPETGSQVAKLASLLNQSTLIKELSSGNDNDYLQNIEQEWIHAQFTAIKRYCAYEKLPLHGIIVVDRLSSTRNCINDLPIAKDHISIVKPCSEKDDAYIALRNAILENPIPIAIKSKAIVPVPLSQLANLRFQELKPAYLQGVNQGLTAYWIPPNKTFQVNVPYKTYGPGNASHVHSASKVLMLSKVDRSIILAEGKKLDSYLTSKTEEGSSMAPNEAMYSTPVGDILSDEDISDMSSEKKSLIILLALHYNDAGGFHHVHKCWIVYPSPIDSRRAEPIFGSCGVYTDFR